MEKMKVIIIGGGAAGLMAAKELSVHAEVILLEAAPRLGGRMHSITSDHSSHIIESGAEFIHGHLPLTLQLLLQANIDYKPVAGEMYRKKNGQWQEINEMTEGWDKLIRKMKDMPPSMTLQEFLDSYYADKKQEELRLHIINYAEGFDVADPARASVLALYKEWSHQEEQNFRIPAGYNSLVKFLQDECEKQGCRLFTNQCVKRIYWEKNKVTAYAIDGERYDADKIIVTIPLKILSSTSAESAIRFIPALDNYRRAANNIGVGAVIKVVLQFQRAFWKDDTGFILSDEIVPTWWTQLPDASPILTGWIGGPKVKRFSGHNHSSIIEQSLQSLANIYELPVDSLKENLQEAHVFNWEETGAYSYPTPETDEARLLLNKPVLGTVFFAGEGLYDGHAQGTVEAGLASGKETADKVLGVKF